MGIGVDGCRAGWLVVQLGDNSDWRIGVFESMEALWSSVDDDRSIVLVDVPIGPPDESSSRACDASARALLGGPRASSVFNPPTRSALRGESWEEAAELNELACGKRLSKQTWALFPKIREEDDFLRADPRLQDRLREVHPEVLFQVLNRGVTLRDKKKAAAGRDERVRILEEYASGAAERFSEFSARYRRSEVQLDDILDAMCAAVVATRFADSLATLPAVPSADSAGLRREMVVPILNV